MKDVRDGFISVNEAARKAGLDRRGVIQRFDPEHADHIPVMVYSGQDGRPIYRIPEDKFSEWMEAHRV